jgi:hypothetical protein
MRKLVFGRVVEFDGEGDKGLREQRRQGERWGFGACILTGFRPRRHRSNHKSNLFQAGKNDDDAFWADGDGVAVFVGAHCIQIEIPKMSPGWLCQIFSVRSVSVAHGEQPFFWSEGDGRNVKL